MERGRAAAAPAEVRQLPTRSFQYCVPWRHTKPNSKICCFLQSVTADLNPISPSDWFTIGSDYQVRDMCRFAIAVDQVKKQLGAVKSAKVCGPDKLPNWILRHVVACINVRVCSLFNSSLCEGYNMCHRYGSQQTSAHWPRYLFPSSWRSTYPPTSLTPVLSKVYRIHVIDTLHSYVFYVRRFVVGLGSRATLGLFQFMMLFVFQLCLF